MFLIRQAGPADFRGIFRLARILDSYNLPADVRHIRRLLRISEASFQGRVPKSRASYLFALESAGRIVGCSLIIPKHGTRGHPHLWFAQQTACKRSRTLRVVRRHPVLRMGWTESGPTEIGGLVVLPGYRGHPEHCGLQISYGRFLYMAMHPERFQRQVLIEYRGAMGQGGRSPFWEAVGRIFTGLSYARADRLSVANKEFIRNLLPREPIYCALLPRPVQEAIGAIHPAAKAAARLAASQGFRRIPQIEPFDGGPYYRAPLKRIRLIRLARRMRLTGWLRGALPTRGRLWLVGTEHGGRFRAVLTRGEVSGGRWRMPAAAGGALRLHPGDWIHVAPVSR